MSLYLCKYHQGSLFPNEFSVYGSSLDETTNDIEPTSKYPWKMDEVIDAMDLIVLNAEIGTCLRAASEFHGSLNVLS
jgi:hypothetical protein